MDDLASPLHAETNGLFRIEEFPIPDLQPGRIANSGDLDDSIARLHAGFGSRRIRLHVSNLRRLVHENGDLVMKAVDCGQEENRKENVHRWPSNRDQEPMPARVREKFTWVSGTIVSSNFARAIC